MIAAILKTAIRIADKMRGINLRETLNNFFILKSRVEFNLENLRSRGFGGGEWWW